MQVSNKQTTNTPFYWSVSTTYLKVELYNLKVELYNHSESFTLALRSLKLPSNIPTVFNFFHG